ncbi:MAG: SGNH/GDSL hydrolase family protein [Candidatus Riflebacteria bacterium]|nr:SGNH/GDSL hydrolase family protein [Candidatus Riflebacteria bacterium]
MKNALFWLVLLALLYICMETGCYLFFKAWSRATQFSYRPLPVRTLPESLATRTRVFADDRHSLIEHHPTLGWRPRADGQWGGCRVSPQRLRGARPYAARPLPGTVRIAAFGDSYTFGDGVDDEQTWTAQLGLARPGLEVLNFGVQAYGMDQSWLRYREEGAARGPHIVLIAFMPESCHLAVCVYRPFYLFQSGVVLTKPRFVLQGDRLTLLPNPLSELTGYERLIADPASVLPRLGEHDFFYHARYHEGPFDGSPLVRLIKVARSIYHLRYSKNAIQAGSLLNARSEAYRISVAMLEGFYREVLANGSVPVILFLPDEQCFRALETDGSAPYASLLVRLSGQGLRCLDALEAFRGRRLETPHQDGTPLFKNGHYTPTTCRLLAAHVASTLASSGLLEPSTIAPAVERERAIDRPAAEGPRRVGVVRRPTSDRR